MPFLKVLGDWITVILGTGAADPMSLARTLRSVPN